MSNSITLLLKDPSIFNFDALRAHCVEHNIEYRTFFEAFDTYLIDPSYTNQLYTASILRKLVFTSIPQEERIFYAEDENDFETLSSTSANVPCSLVAHFAHLANWPITLVTDQIHETYGTGNHPVSLYGLSNTSQASMNHFSVTPFYPMTPADGNCFFHSILQIARSAFEQQVMERAFTQETLLYNSNTSATFKPYEWLHQIGRNSHIKIGIYSLTPNSFESGSAPPTPEYIGYEDTTQAIYFIRLVSFPMKDGCIQLGQLQFFPNCLYTADGQTTLSTSNQQDFCKTFVELMATLKLNIIDISQENSLFSSRDPIDLTGRITTILNA